VPSPAQSAHGAAVFERALRMQITNADIGVGIEGTLESLTRAGSQIRERLSVEHWRLLVDTAAAFRADCERARGEGDFSADEVLSILAKLALQLAAITGAQTDRMTRDDGWRLLAIGRHIERVGELARALRVLVECGALAHGQGFELALELFDSTITYRSMYQSRVELPPLIDLLVINTDNTRALAGVLRRMLREMQRLPAEAAPELMALVPGPGSWASLADLCAIDAEGSLGTLLALLEQVARAADALSDAIVARFFAHAGDRFQLLNV
jgi:uncharacterized alpha-E superfamily protein